MTLAEKLALQLPNLPPSIKQLFDAERAAGGELIDLEIDRTNQTQTVILVCKHPFHILPSAAPPGISYRENLDRDPMLYEFHTADERVRLVTCKFKPMKFEPIVGPPNPTEAHIALMNQIAQREEAKAAERATAAKSPPPSSHNPALSDPANRFINSMTMTFDMWHDGLGYDLAALDASTPEDHRTIETILINHHPKDWRDIEALARIDTPTARAAVEAALKSPDTKIRQEAMRQLPEKIDPSDREQRLIQTLNTANLYDGLSQAIDEVPDFHPPAVIETLLRGALNRDGQAAIHFAALLYFLHGQSAEPFDWNHRPFFLRFDTSNRAERIAVFKEMCQTIGVDASKYVH